MRLREEEWATAPPRVYLLCVKNFLGKKLIPCLLRLRRTDKARSTETFQHQSKLHLLSRQWTIQLVTCCVRGETRRDELSPKMTQSKGKPARKADVRQGHMWVEDAQPFLLKSMSRRGRISDWTPRAPINGVAFS